MSRGRTRRGRNNDNELSVWEFANKLRECPTTKNAMPNLPESTTEKEADDYIGLLCLLERETPENNQFGKQFVQTLCALTLFCYYARNTYLRACAYYYAHSI